MKSKRFLTIHSGWCSATLKETVVGLVGPGNVYTAGVSVRAANVTSLVALGPVVLLSFDKSAVAEVLLRNPNLLLEMTDLAIRKVQTQQVFLQQAGASSVESRIAAVLWNVGVPQLDGTRCIPAAVSQSTLASYLGISREAVSLKRKALVTSKYLFKVGDDWYLDPMTPMLIAND